MKLTYACGISDMLNKLMLKDNLVDNKYEIYNNTSKIKEELNKCGEQ